MGASDIDSETADSLRRKAKDVLRRRISAVRRVLPIASVAERSARIVARLLEHPWIVSANGVALYSCMIERRETDLAALHEWLASRHIRIYYPFMTRIEGGYSTGFRLLRPGDELSLQSHRFAEPCPDAPVAKRGDIDVAIVPALAVAMDGHRLGTGSGFYDATLPDICPPSKSIVVGYDFQRVIELPSEPHDWRCDAVITDAP